ncbi:M16 family metallopeptidase [Trichlorobacter ammonificans]|uniref:Peptidase M16 domain protein n=1 Tax=Trichlorobacter ammonificans TaxID=2916410 RepID=A0ABN8HGA0_9BACT|nr:pitrilysin family protein [Trichlorobacter ammonificans]CAH2030202.1 Peptidase M16 domain protein [Trichlorobacter ammonificans]
MSRLLIRAFIAVLLCVSTVWSAETADPRTMRFPALDFRIPKAERVVLDNGIPVFLLPDRELPIVTVSALIRTGSVYDPVGKSGLASLTGTLLRGGGAGALAPDALDEHLEFMASSVESAFGSDSGTVGMTTLTRNLEPTLAIFRDVLFTPRFDEKRLTVARRQLLEAIRRQNDDPKEMADRELMKMIYAGHPLGVVPTEASVAAITREEIVAFHRRHVRPDTMILAVSGDFERERLIPLLNRLIGSQRPADKQALPPLPPVPVSFKPELLLLPKQVNQSVIRLGHLGIDKNDPDLYAVRVLDFILGGSFTSRLMMEIRTNQGLAYNVSSSFEVGRRFIGSFSAETETRADATARTIALMTAIIDGIRKEPVTDQELTLAKESIINSFLFGFTSSASTVAQQARLEFYGYAPDYLERYRERISAVTREDVLRASRRLLHPDAFKLVVVGNETAFDRPLAEFGAVTRVQPD